MKKISLMIMGVLMTTPALAMADTSAINQEMLLNDTHLTKITSESVPQISAEKTEELKQQILSLKSGDTLIIPNGKYENLGVIDIDADNVTIKAETAGKTWLTGLVQLKVNGDKVVLDGLVFTDGGPAERFGGIRINGKDDVLKNSTFKDFNHDYPYEPDAKRQEYPKYLWVSLWGKDAQLLNNRFEDKNKRGTLIGVQKGAEADNHIIKHNIFLDQKANQHNEFAIEKAIRYNANTWEVIRVGDSKSSQWPSHTTIEENLFVDMDGENEMITLKSGDNIIRGNTIFNSASMISLRHGKANTVENNIILGNEKQLTGGIRAYDEDHVIRNNYISGTRGSEGAIAGNADLRGAIVINTGIIDPSKNEVLDQSIKGKELNKQWTPENITVSHNTIIDADWGIVHGNQKYRVSLYDNSAVDHTFAGSDIHFDHNLVMAKNADQIAVRASDEFPLVNATYKDEIYSGKVIESKQLNNFSTEVPKLENKDGLLYSSEYGADISKLKVITTEIAGPNYIIETK